MKNLVCLIIVLLLFSCESDPIQSTPHHGLEFEQYIFKLEHALENYQNDFQNITRGKSNLLFSGHVIDTLNDGTIIEDISRALISIDLSKFSNYEICSSVVHIESPKVSLYSSAELPEVLSEENNNLTVKLISVTDYDEDEKIWSESGDYLIDISTIIDENLSYSIADSSVNELIIDLPDLFITEDSTSLVCENNNINLLIEYSPNETDSLQHIEWYSSNFEYGNSLTPKLNLDYIKMEPVDTTEYQFTLDNYSNNTQGYYYINNPLDNNWSTTYFMNIEDLTHGMIDSLIDFKNTLIEDPLIDTSNDSTKVDLATLKIKLNNNPPQNSFSQIFLALDNVIAYVNEDDPSGDDYNGIDSTLTDGNNQYDITYNSIGTIIANEKFNDFGSDNCKDQYEKGNNECCENNEECTYNNQGSENNNLLNWIDNDNNGLWSDGDSGEEWTDIGADGCPDEYESGDLDNPCLDSAHNNSSNIDPNGDNYNPDPEGDNYSYDNTTGTEGNEILDWSDQNNNQIWDSGEGEQWLDYGADGLPNTNDTFENDMIYQEFEPFFDYGLDNIDNQNEEGFCNAKNICTEDNLQYDVGELKDIDDVGEDGCKDEYETGVAEDPCYELINDSYIPGTDPNGDNYNIDPNGDNYNSETDSGFENNGKLDWTNQNNNQIWDVGEGEQWFDYGLDQTQNPYEQYLPANQIIVSLSENNYEINIENFDEYSEVNPPEVGDNKVALWISSITYNASDETYDLVLSVYSERQLDGIRFKLNHPNDLSNLKVTWTEDYERHYTGQYSYIEEEESQQNIFKDLSLYPLHDLNFYSESLSDSLILINYAYDISCDLASDEFRTFINNYPQDAISLQHSKIVIPIETSSVSSINSEFKIDIGIGSDDISDQYLASSNYINELPYGYIQEGDTRLEINIGNLIQYYVTNNDILFDSFTIKNDSQSNNFNSLYLNKNNSYIHLVVQK